jgi:hypothetical protein
MLLNNIRSTPFSNTVQPPKRILLPDLADGQQVPFGNPSTGLPAAVLGTGRTRLSADLLAGAAA